MQQGSDERKKVGRHAAPGTDAASSQNVIRADTDLYGDEADAPRRKRSAPPKRPARRSTPNGAKKQTGTGRNRRPGRSIFESLSRSGAKVRPSRTAFIRIAYSEGTSSRFQGLYVLGHRVPLWPLITAVLLIVIVSVIVMSNSNVAVDEQQVTVVGLSEDLENFRILVISDLNGRRFGDKQSSLLRTISSLSYDAVFCLGDMVGNGGDPDPFYELLDGLPSSKPVYFICGDRDPGPYIDTPREIRGTLSQRILEDWILGATERGAIYVDSPVSLKVGSSVIWITPATLLNLDGSELMETWKTQTEQEQDGVLSGLDSDHDTLPVTSYRYRIATRFYQSLAAMNENDFYLALAHEVPSDKTLDASTMHDSSHERYLDAPELLLAGHYCGGVWHLPFLGPVYVPDDMMDRSGWFPDIKEIEGLSPHGETQVYISGGLSTNGSVPLMAFRLLNQPQISVLTLTATLPENMLDAE